MRLPITICVIAYGDNASLARRFLETIYRHTAPAHFMLRAGLNEVSDETARCFADYASAFGNIELFIEEKNIFKSPLMRRMFKERPLETNWVVWFDDDSYVTRSDWLQRLALQIARRPSVAQWGQQFTLWRRDEEIAQFIESAPWYRGVPLQQGCDPDGTLAFEFHFATGGFWTMRREAIEKLDWPDARLIHAAEDFVLGEALRQNGFELGSFDTGICINDAPRRNAAAQEAEQIPTAPSNMGSSFTFGASNHSGDGARPPFA